MKIKKYNAANMNEAMAQIKNELGEEAVILNSKVVFTGGILGFFKKKGIEVIAAVDPQERQQPMATQVKKKRLEGMPAEKIAYDRNPNRVGHTNKEDNQSAHDVLKEMGELKQLVKKVQLNQEKDTLSAPLKKVSDLLSGQEIAQDVIDTILVMLNDKEGITEEEAIEFAKSFLLASLPSEANRLFQRKYVNVVGPTGVGKTTTLAKLAAESALKYRKKVAFITTDTYRIAAIDQLKTYAKILNVPIEVAYNVEDFRKAIERFSHYDLVFIDTAGRNFRNAEYVEELNKIISFDEQMETYMVLALTSKQRDMEEIVGQFSSIPLSYFIFTKMDETSTIGAAYNMVVKYNLNIAYVTDGQNVPDDLKKASPDFLVDSMFKVNRHE
ncbi:flagellar biosynthesis protein FlhF [Bacillus sp. 1P06AnD]|uniref:flagellar biosynthesis protein FlhF n=1 Tax=Bacillus sp. 1P06AnD TaxID=3132208 RepID=UPI00399EFB8B